MAGFGSVSVGALIAACGDNGSGDSGRDTSPTGRTAPAESRDRSDAALAERFDDTSSCTLTLEQTEGPFYFDADAVRSDIREEREGVRLRLGVRVREAESCEPLRNAIVDIWHCDARGEYSGFEAAGGDGRTDDQRYLRGAQVTDFDGIVEFVTIYPGWYQGRTTHIHAKVHVDNQTALTTQFFFDENVNERVYSRRPYSERTGRDVFNDNDGIFDASLLLDLSREGDGYLGLISVDVRAT